MKNLEINRAIQNLLSNPEFSNLVEHLDNIEIKRFSDNMRRALSTGTINIPERLDEDTIADLAKGIADALLDEVGDAFESRWLIQRVWTPYAIKHNLV